MHHVKRRCLVDVNPSLRVRACARVETFCFCADCAVIGLDCVRFIGRSAPSMGAGVSYPHIAKEELEARDTGI